MAISKTEYAQRIQSSRSRLYRTAFCYVKNEQDALDIVGEAVCKGLEALHQLRQVEFFDTWMTRIVIHTALSHLRKHALRPENNEELPESLPATEAGLTPEESIDLYQALDTLGGSERTYVILRFFEERSFREMAEILNLPEATVKSRLYRILKKLNHQLSARKE
ncbi:sigma-70 family RNA polymerase sigma factor [Oscillibacter sp.]|uniref:sigma-70 family RNA polymerase sigma factor n=1 Tax=Oscillibacter sp. TaxID=1945593 RepID=UPI00261DB51E|nr:sigma-70 family RNA polymerase sigma factor [Oscillibacter sp.]MDD3347661.1 sigma-70 family RNA polymerase sigma factor [Oscillibacter sp.]